MTRWQGQTAPDAPPPERVLRELLTGTLRPVLERQPPAAIEAATRVLVEAATTIEEEIFLVEPASSHPEPRRRPRSRRRPG
jgi:hypothetical protein